MDSMGINMWACHCFFLTKGKKVHVEHIRPTSLGTNFWPHYWYNSILGVPIMRLHATTHTYILMKLIMFYNFTFLPCVILLIPLMFYSCPRSSTVPTLSYRIPLFCCTFFLNPLVFYSCLYWPSPDQFLFCVLRCSVPFLFLNCSVPILYPALFYSFMYNLLLSCCPISCLFSSLCILWCSVPVLYPTLYLFFCLFLSYMILFWNVPVLYPPMFCSFSVSCPTLLLYHACLITFCILWWAVPVLYPSLYLFLCLFLWSSYFLLLSCILPCSVPFLYLVLLCSCPISCLFYSLTYPPLIGSWPVSFLSSSLPYPHLLCILPVLFHSIKTPALLSCLLLFLLCSLSCSIPLCILACSIPVLYLACFNPSVSCPVFRPVPLCPVFLHVPFKKSYILPCIMPALSVCEKSIYFLLPMKTQYTYTLSNDLATKGIYLYFFVYLYCIVRDLFFV